MNKRTLTLLAGSTALLLASGAYADPNTEAEQLAQSKHCFACHDPKMQKIGPSFRDIAHRFAGLHNAKPMLERLVHTGTDNPTTVYHWGSLRMPPEGVRVPVSDAEASVLVDYILSFDKK